jgi:hypothetical protein
MAEYLPTNPVLRGFFDTGAAFGPLDRDANPNQRCAGLLALDRLGADDAALKDFAAQQDARLQPAPSAATWPAGDAWAECLGQAQAWAPYRHLMGQWLFYEDAGDMLYQTLPLLLKGSGGAGCAGLIRTAYAVQAHHRQELADALAYWASCHLALPPVGGVPAVARPSADPEPALRRLRAAAAPGQRLDQAMQAVAREAAFEQAVAMVAPDAQLVQRLSALAAQAFAATGAPLAAQLVISAQALDVLLQFIDEEAVPAALQDYWRAFAAVVCVADLRDAPPPDAQTWRVILARVRDCRDPRAICLVDSCRALEKTYGPDPVWRQAATRALWP